MSTKNQKNEKNKVCLTITVQLSLLERLFTRALFFRFCISSIRNTMADAVAPAADDGAKRRTFRRFSYRGVDLEQLLELKTEEMVQLFGARQRRRYVFFFARKWR